MVAGGLPVLAQIVPLLKVLAAHLARIGDLGGLVGALVDHQVVRLGESPLAVLANELALRTHLAAEIGPAVIVVDSHYSKHFDRRYVYWCPAFKVECLSGVLEVRRCGAARGSPVWVLPLSANGDSFVADSRLSGLSSALFGSAMGLFHSMGSIFSPLIAICSDNTALNCCLLG